MSHVLYNHKFEPIGIIALGSSHLASIYRNGYFEVPMWLDFQASQACHMVQTVVRVHGESMIRNDIQYVLLMIKDHEHSQMLTTAFRAEHANMVLNMDPSSKVGSFLIACHGG